MINPSFLSIYQEQIVKATLYKLTYTIVILLFIIVLAACSSSSSTQETQSSTPTEVSTEENQEPSGSTDVGQIEFPDSNEATDSELFVLEGAETTESGLQFLELVAGDGRAPASGDMITMHFVGTLPDGTTFVDSKEGEEPITVIFDREQLLPGWEEGVAMMTAGGKAKMVLPSELAFGEQGYGMVPPNSQIILEVELLSVEATPQPTDVPQADYLSTENGVEYYDITEGEGDEAVPNSIVTTEFTLWVQGEDSNDFILSSTYREPVTFVLGRGDTVFPGWEDGVLNMRLGGKRQLVIPPEMAFGEQGATSIPPNATIIMEVELIEMHEPVAMTEVDEGDLITTESGLKYFDIVEGEGESPAEGETVVVHYSGWLEDGQLFDSSIERGSPFSFVIGTGNVIPGWDEGVATMKVGGKRQLVIPADLAYGETGSGGVIPPGATLIFDVELLEIQP